VRLPSDVIDTEFTTDLFWRRVGGARNGWWYSFTQAVSSRDCSCVSRKCTRTASRARHVITITYGLFFFASHELVRRKKDSWVKQNKPQRRFGVGATMSTRPRRNLAFASPAKRPPNMLCDDGSNRRNLRSPLLPCRVKLSCWAREWQRERSPARKNPPFARFPTSKCNCRV